VTSTSGIGFPATGPADLNRVHPEQLADQTQEASFQLALAEANGSSSVSPASTFSLDPSALNAADEAWVNFVAVSEQLQNPSLSLEKRNVLLSELEEKLRTFREQSGPLVQQVDNYFALRVPSKA
jgi:hypothetical protein